MVQHQPELRDLPVALTSVPVIVEGSVHGAIVVLRDVDRPFGDDEVLMGLAAELEEAMPWAEKQLSLIRKLSA